MSDDTAGQAWLIIWIEYLFRHQGTLLLGRLLLPAAFAATKVDVVFLCVKTLISFTLRWRNRYCGRIQDFDFLEVVLSFLCCISCVHFTLVRYPISKLEHSRVLMRLRVDLR